MSLFNELGVNAADIDIAGAEDKLKRPDLPPPGVYHAALESVRTITSTNSTGRELCFVIISGPHKGQKVEDALWLPKKEADPDPKKEKSRQVSQNKVTIYMHRLGILRKEPIPNTNKFKTVQVPDKYDFIDCLGTCCFINVKNEEEEYTNKNGKLVKIMKAKLEFEGVLNPDDPKCKEVPIGTPADAKELVAGAAAVAAATSPDKFSDL